MGFHPKRRRTKKQLIRMMEKKEFANHKKQEFLSDSEESEESVEECDNKSWKSNDQVIDNEKIVHNMVFDLVANYEKEVSCCEHKPFKFNDFDIPDFIDVISQKEENDNEEDIESECENDGDNEKEFENRPDEQPDKVDTPETTPDEQPDEQPDECDEKNKSLSDILIKSDDMVSITRNLDEESDISESVFELKNMEYEFNVDEDDVDVEFESLIYRFQNEFYILNQLSFHGHSSSNDYFQRCVYSVLRKSDRKKFVIIIVEDMRSERYMDGIPREILIMQKLKGCKYFSQLLSWFKFGLFTYAFITPYYVNCDSHLISKSLKHIQIYMKSLLSGVSELHKRGITHRDYCNHNTAYDPVKELVVSIDWDNSAFDRPDGFFADVGRDNYDSPEKVQVTREIEKLRNHNDNHKSKIKKLNDKFKGYTNKVDIYSVGVMFWMLLCKHSSSPRQKTLRRWIHKAKENRWAKKFTEINLLLKML